MEKIVALAITKALDKEIKGFRAPVGVTPIDHTVTVRVTGSVSKSEDTEYTPTVDIPLKLALAIAFEKAGFQRELAKKLIAEAMIEALSNADKNEVFAERLKDIEAAERHVAEVIGKLPKKIRTGPTSCKVTLQEVA